MTPQLQPVLKHAARILAVLMLLAHFGLSQVTAQHANRSGNDIVDVAVAAGDFTTLAAALEAADLVDALKSRGPFTVFAPTDAAFAKLPRGTVENLLKPENRDQLVAILTYHVVEGRVLAADAANLRAATTLNGQRIGIDAKDGGLFIDQARVTTADVRASNGVIHVIDDVLMPTTDAIPTVARKAGSFNTLLAAVKAAGLAETLAGDGPFTVFAPTDEAFAQLPDGTVENLLKPENRSRLQEILAYHVVEGRVYADAALKAGAAPTLAGPRVAIGFENGTLRVNNATIVATDVAASNGVIHVIDRVLLPAEGLSQASDAVDLLELAIDRGVPLFNMGQRAACAAIYEVAVTALASRSDLPNEVRAPLRKALQDARGTHDAGDRAWTLRRGMDSALAALDQQMTMARR